MNTRDRKPGVMLCRQLCKRMERAGIDWLVVLKLLTGGYVP